MMVSSSDGASRSPESLRDFEMTAGIIRRDAVCMEMTVFRKAMRQAESTNIEQSEHRGHQVHWNETDNGRAFRSSRGLSFTHI